MNAKLIAGEYRFPADASRERAITVYALAPYERGVHHEVDSFIGVVPKPGANPERFEASSMKDVANKIATLSHGNAEAILGDLVRRLYNTELDLLAHDEEAAAAIVREAADTLAAYDGHAPVRRDSQRPRFSLVAGLKRLLAHAHR